MIFRELRASPGRPRTHFACNEREAKRVYVAVAHKERGLRGAQIYEFRASMGMSRRQLAREMHVTGQAIYLWEHGQFEPQELAWAAFLRVRENYHRRMKRAGKDLDGGPLMATNRESRRV
jgi:DNA-binding transcriptional regulator YiaG